MTLRYALMGLALLAAPAGAQTYGTYASQADLGGAEPDCIVTDVTGEFVIYFDQATASIQAYAPGDGVIVGADNAALNAATGLTIDRCRDGAFSENTFDAYFILADSDNTDIVVKLDADANLTALTNPADATDPAQGSIGLAVSNDNQALYISRSEFNGAPEDGVYSVNTTDASQTPAVVLQNADLDLNGIAVDAAGDLYAASSEFGGGDFVNVVVKITDPDGSPALSTIASPCADGLFVNCTDGGIEELVIATNLADGSQRMFVANNSFGGPDGEVVAAFDLDGSDGEIVFTQAAAVAALGIAGITTAGNNGYLAFGGETLLVASRADFGGTTGIFSVTVPFPVAAEGAPTSAFALAVAPNPSAGAARVAVTAEASGALTVDVLDLLGRRVTTLFEGSAAAGQTVTATASGLAPGVYVVRAQSAAGVATQRLTVVR